MKSQLLWLAIMALAATTIFLAHEAHGIFHTNKKEPNKDEYGNIKSCWDPKPDVVMYAWEYCPEGVQLCKQFCAKKMHMIPGMTGKCMGTRCACIMPWIKVSYYVTE